MKPSIVRLTVLSFASVLVITFAIFARAALQLFNGFRRTV